MIKAIIVLWTLVLMGCNTVKVGASLEEKNYSLADIRAAIIGISGESREVSQNGREYYSQYFSRKKEEKFNPLDSLERAYAHFLILGERRPYEIRVVVYIEKKTKRGYENLGEDRVWSKKILEELKTRLSSRDGRNIIDDFRSF